MEPRIRGATVPRREDVRELGCEPEVKGNPAAFLVGRVAVSLGMGEVVSKGLCEFQPLGVLK